MEAGHLIRRTIEQVRHAHEADPEDLGPLERLTRLATIVRAAFPEIDLWPLQLSCFRTMKQPPPAVRERRGAADPKIERWIERIQTLGNALNIRKA